MTCFNYIWDCEFVFGNIPVNDVNEISMRRNDRFNSSVIVGFTCTKECNSFEGALWMESQDVYNVLSYDLATYTYRSPLLSTSIRGKFLC